ncbi:hypothetical protein [Ensifer adhaerens]|uniref:hypothetical protein n=1 Tax=Ensifer adhaerens TaxID=106592 RepID=UPI001F300DBC|nr:hypothetical protein [Ensifer adhaerens]
MASISASLTLSLLFGTTYLFLTAFINFGNIGVFTGLIETLFAAYMAIIFNNLFPDTMPKLLSQ